MHVRMYEVCRKVKNSQHRQGGRANKDFTTLPHTNDTGHGTVARTGANKGTPWLVHQSHQGSRLSDSRERGRRGT